MENQKIQSIEFDIQEIKKEVNKLNKDIEYKKDQNKFVDRNTKMVGVGAGALAWGLAKQAVKLHPIGRIGMAVAAGKGLIKGYDWADAAMGGPKSEVLLLEQERDKLNSMLERRKTELQNAK
ncbi:MAG: hypothetical protein COB76_02985 [Alphaproteobacteria bacterium]|nr:MAG: hypothetical protein COB76_02985 [Alphaproteobacteria bacterium]